MSARLTYGRNDSDSASLDLGWMSAARLAANLANILSRGGKFSQRSFTTSVESPRVSWKNRDYFIVVERTAE